MPQIWRGKKSLTIFPALLLNIFIFVTGFFFFFFKELGENESSSV